MTEDAAAADAAVDETPADGAEHAEDGAESAEGAEDAPADSDAAADSADAEPPVA